MRLALALALAAPATLSAQSPIASWDFNSCDSNGYYTSTQNSGCNSRGKVSSYRRLRIMKENGSNGNCVLVLGTGDFVPAQPGDSNYRRNALYLTVTPSRSIFKLSELSFVAIRTECSIVLGADLYYDEDPGSGGDNFQTRIGRVMLPRESSSTAARRTVRFDLSGVAALQNVPQEISLRLNFFGAKGSGCSGAISTCLDDINVDADCRECPKASVQVLGRPCEPKSFLSMTAPPAFGTAPWARINSNHPGAKAYLFLSIGCGTGIKLPGTDCVLWLHRKPYIWGGKTTNSNGNTAFQLPILPNYSAFAGVEVGLQALLWTNGGDGLSNGLCLKLGCR